MASLCVCLGLVTLSYAYGKYRLFSFWGFFGGLFFVVFVVVFFVFFFKILSIEEKRFYAEIYPHDLCGK